MRRAQSALLLLLIASALTARTATAQTARGPYTDALARCLVTSTTEADKSMLVKWIFVVVSVHPVVQPILSVADSTRVQLDQAMADLLQRLLTVSCTAEARQAMKYEGDAAMEASFGALGEVAMRNLFADPAVSAGAAAFAQYLDEDALLEALQPADRD